MYCHCHNNVGLHGGHKGMDMVRNNAHAVAFKQCQIGTKGPKVYQENIPHTITPPPPACTVVTRHDGSMFSSGLHQILTLPSESLNRNRDSSDQATFSSLQLSNFGELLQIVASFSYFLVEMSGTRWGLLLL